MKSKISLLYNLITKKKYNKQNILIFIVYILIELDELNIVEYILSSNKYLINKITNLEYLLYWAVTNFRNDFASILIKYGIYNLNLKKKYNNNTFLNMVCENYNEKLALEILEYGDINCDLKHVNNKYKTAFITASGNTCGNMNNALLKMLEYGPLECNLNYVNNLNETPLMILCDHYLENIALKVLDFNPQIINLKNISNEKETALIICCRNKLEKVALKILEKVEYCNINQKNKKNETALDIAIRNKLYNVIKKINNLSS